MSLYEVPSGEVCANAANKNECERRDRVYNNIYKQYVQ